MKLKKTSAYTFSFSSNKENSDEFSSHETNSNSYKFRCHLNSPNLCIEFLSKIYRDTTFNVYLQIEYQEKQIERTFLFDFSLFSNTFILDLSKWMGDLVVDKNNNIHMKIEIAQTTPKNTFCGLTNLGATCYINSLLQTLKYMYKFQEKLFEAKDTFYATNLKRLFYAMSTKQNDYESPLVNQFIRNLPFVESVNEHQDVHEFSKILFDRLELENKELIKETIEGKLCTTFKLDCGCELKKDDPFQDIQLQLNGCKSVKEALDNFIQPDIIDEFTCDKHGKTKASKTVLIGESPEYLFVLLNRFTFDWETGESVKDNRYIKFDETLDINKYTINNKTDEYDLLSVIVHVGSVTQGHFYAYIKADGGWNKFNDTAVTQALPEEAMDWNYGGRNSFTGKQKKFSAYYLIYKKKSDHTNIYMVENVPSVIEQEKIQMHVPVIENRSIEGYTGPGYFNNSSYDYKRTPVSVANLSQFDNVEVLIKKSKIMQEQENGEFKEIKTQRMSSELPLVYFSNTEKGVFVFVKYFTNTAGCNIYSEKLKMDKIAVIQTLDVFDEYKNIFREIKCPNKTYCENISEFDQIKDGDILIITDEPQEIVEKYLVFLCNSRFLFVDVGGLKLPVFVDRKLSLCQLKSTIEQELVCSGLEIVGIDNKICKIHNTRDVECTDCHIQHKNIILTQFNMPVYVNYVGVSYGKISLGSIPHLHTFVSKEGATRDDIIRQYRMSPHMCIRACDHKDDFDIIHIFKDCPRVIYYKNKLDQIQKGGLIVFIDKMSDPMVVCMLNGMKEIVGYPCVVERCNTIKEFRTKYMVLNKIYRYDESNQNFIEYGDEEIIGLDENEYLLVEED